jgi:hypothetical protein
MVPTHLRRSLLVVLLAALIATLPAATALAANPGTTSTFHHQVLLIKWLRGWSESLEA